jgi:hypothetical protein
MPAQAGTPQPWTSHEQQPRCGKPLENVHQPQSPVRRNLLHARQSFAANIASGLSLHGFFRNVAAFAKGFAIPPHLLRIKPLRRGTTEADRVQMRRFAASPGQSRFRYPFKTWSW